MVTTGSIRGVAPEVNVLWNPRLCQAARGSDQDTQKSTSLLWIPVPQEHILSTWFSSSFCGFPFLSFHKSLQQSSLKYSLKFWNWADAIESGCSADHRGHLMGLAQSRVLFSHCFCPMALWLPATELPHCRRVWASELLICNSNRASAPEERKMNPQNSLSVQWSSYWRTGAVGSPRVTASTQEWSLGYTRKPVLPSKPVLLPASLTHCFGQSFLSIL